MTLAPDTPKPWRAILESNVIAAIFFRLASPCAGSTEQLALADSELVHAAAASTHYEVHRLIEERADLTILSPEWYRDVAQL